jgi:ferritin-like metal-binding protein YciE
MALNTLEDLYVDHLKDLYNAEQQMIKALPKLANKSTSPKLKDAFESHLRQTEAQVGRLETVFQNMQKDPRGKKCMGMEGLIQEGEEALTEEMDPIVRDSAIIGASQKAEHYEISAYGTAIAYARLLGDDEAINLFKQSLNEEAQADEMLTKIAVGGVNEAAVLR